jgi:hypothetical protein
MAVLEASPEQGVKEEREARAAWPGFPGKVGHRVKQAAAVLSLHAEMATSMRKKNAIQQALPTIRPVKNGFQGPLALSPVPTVASTISLAAAGSQGLVAAEKLAPRGTAPWAALLVPSWEVRAEQVRVGQARAERARMAVATDFRSSATVNPKRFNATKTFSTNATNRMGHSCCRGLASQRTIATRWKESAISMRSQIPTAKGPSGLIMVWSLRTVPPLERYALPPWVAFLVIQTPTFVKAIRSSSAD